MNSTISERRGVAWPSAAVFALDRWLRRRQDIYEFTNHPQCLFRIQCARAECAFELTDGTVVRPGSRLLTLHLWNEHVPHIGPRGPTLAWAHQMNRAIRMSLGELARYLRGQQDLQDIAAIRGDLRVSGAEQAKQLARIVARYGFETATGEFDSRGVLHRIGDALLVMMLVLVTNPPALQAAPFRYSNMRIYLSRAVLEERCAAARAIARPVARKTSGA